MQLFICWSGERSRSLAEATSRFLKAVFGSALEEPFVSTRLEKGVFWFEEILERLRTADAGVLCLTPEALRSPWLHFEAGALAMGMAMSTAEGGGAQSHGGGAASSVRARVYTLLHQITPAELTGPLSSYQSTTTTEQDLAQLVFSLADLRGLSREAARKRFARAWPRYRAELDRLQVGLQSVVPEFEELFDRKTFYEPLQRCSAQSWVDRYIGAREVREQLAQHSALIRRSCPPYQWYLFDELQAELDGYAMDLRSLLIEGKRFPLGDGGELEITPPAIRTVCEERRLKISTLVSRILDPLDAPHTDDAVCFMTAETFAERKRYVHRLEGRVLKQLDAKRKASAWDEVLSDLLGESRALDAFITSTWALDRIFLYLVLEHGAKLAGQRDEHGTLQIVGAVRLELERVRAGGGQGSLMPLHYALGALGACLPPSLAPSVRRDAADVLDAIEAYISERPDSRDRGGQVRQTIASVRARLGRVEAAAPEATVGAIAVFRPEPQPATAAAAREGERSTSDD